MDRRLNPKCKLLRGVPFSRYIIDHRTLKGALKGLCFQEKVCRLMFHLIPSCVSGYGAPFEPLCASGHCAEWTPRASVDVKELGLSG